MTFLGGGRACIGFKFAEMEISEWLILSQIFLSTDRSLEQVLSTLLSHLHFALPTAVNGDGVRKEIYWRIDGLQVPVVREPHGDFKTPQVPLVVRLVTEGDFS